MQQKSVKEKKVREVKQAGPSFSIGNIMLYIIPIVIVTFFAFTPALKNSFTNWDDNGYVFENIHLGKPLSEAIAFFFGPHYFVGTYIPLTMIVYALELHAAGMEPQLFHEVNVLLHLLNVVLVFLFIYLLSGRKMFVAAIVALFFGVHPMHVESVAWVAELKDVLYTCFFIAGLIAYCKYLETTNKEPVAGSESEASRKLQWILLSFFFFLLSVFSKPSAIVFPLVLLLLDFYTRRRFDKWAWIEKAPFFVIALVMGIVAIKAQQADRLLHDYYPVSQRIFFAAYAYLSYLFKFILPVHLSNYYPYPQLVDGHLPYWLYATPVVIAALGYIIYRTLSSTRLIAFGFLFFTVNVLLVLQLVSVGDAVMADRYTYVSYIGLLFMVAMGIHSLYNNPAWQRYKSAVTAVIVVLALACSYVTYGRCSVWENNDTIADDLLEKYPDDRLALNNKGYLLFYKKRYDESITLFKKAIQEKPDYIMAYINLANSYMALKDNVTALQVITAALVYAPHDFNLLNTKGMLLIRQGQYAEGLSYYQRSFEIKKDNVDVYMYQSQYYYSIKDYDNDIKALDTGLKYVPDHYLLLNNKGYALFLKGNYKEAIDCFNASLRQKPDYDVASVNLSNCYKAMNDLSKK
ncbi:MAG: Tetratricopeptide repeat protein [Flavipsychrobacter sp.]|nr:Tetratricopeptide repeat protein [Flavipsychrobacter sp.]